VEIKKAIPKGITIASVKSTTSKGRKSTLTKRSTLPESVTSEQVKALIAKSEWLKAKQFALAYRREGGKDAERLLKQIQSNIEKEAEALFIRGRLEFRRERLDEAIRYWGEAATMMPENLEYVDALRRAQQLQERLQVLKSEAENGEPQKQD